jgi:cytochrome c-type biogenesis protein
MAFTSLGLLEAFGAGLLSFLAPCVLPLVPGYLSYLAGVSLDETQSQPSTRWRVSLHALWFVLGCALLLTLLGVIAASFASLFHTYQLVLERISGLLLILFGIALTGLVPLPWLSRDHRLQVKSGQSTWWRSGLIGLTFGASWSACASPLLGAILVLTAVGLRPLQGALVMLVFAMGQGVPFLLVGILVDHASTFLRRIRRYTVLFSYVAGAILILIGISLLLNLFSNYG